MVHGKVVAELSFGFWVALLADEYNRSLWAPCLRHAFEGRVRRRTLHAQINELRRLRNRIAHHEPLLFRDLEADHESIVDVAARIARVLGREIQATSIVPSVLAQRPGGSRSGS